MTNAHAPQFLAELIGQLFHTDTLITEQAEWIEVLETEMLRLRAALGEATDLAA